MRAMTDSRIAAQLARGICALGFAVLLPAVAGAQGAVLSSNVGLQAGKAQLTEGKPALGKVSSHLLAARRLTRAGWTAAQVQSTAPVSIFPRAGNSNWQKWRAERRKEPGRYRSIFRIVTPILLKAR